VSLEIYLDTPGTRLYWDSETQWIHIEYRKWYSAEEVHLGIETFLQALRDHRASKCLSDSRQRQPLPPEAQRELIEGWGPQAAVLGLKQLAIVVPQIQLGLVTVESLVRGYRRYVETEAFATVEEAAAWLSVRRFAAVPRPG
jgi:hypothetical protein